MTQPTDPCLCLTNTANLSHRNYLICKLLNHKIKECYAQVLISGTTCTLIQNRKINEFMGYRTKI